MAIPPQTPSQRRGLFSGPLRKLRANGLSVIENPLVSFTDDELKEDVQRFRDQILRSVDFDNLLRAARVAKDVRMYDQIARDKNPTEDSKFLVQLTPEEKKALRQERDNPFSERGMRVVILTVSLAALLQGFVQSSFNGASLVKASWGFQDDTMFKLGKPVSNAAWELGAANGSPWFFAAFFGCPLSIPINYWFGRRGGIAIAAFFILASSVGAVFVTNWKEMFCVRVFNGIGMGVKAVSTTILASETAVGFWRGSAILAWQLWVAFGIFLGFAFNLMFTTATPLTTFQLIQGAPIIPALALLVVSTFFCPESPRYYLMQGPNYDPEMAYKMLRRVRNTELQALRDIYMVYKSVQHVDRSINCPGATCDDISHAKRPTGFWRTILSFFRQFGELFQKRRLYNAVIATSTVNLAQQLCGINVWAFYSGMIFRDQGQSVVKAMAYSLGFGAINFCFALPAIRSIDTLGRRKWLLGTLPLMALFMLGAALSFRFSNPGTQSIVLAVFLYLFAAAYSPGLGPIPFTLASESFPLSHREAGTAWAIAVNLGWAGLLSICFPRMANVLGKGGALGLFSGFNVLAFIMVFLLVEETQRRSLEELDDVFKVPKRRFMGFQLSKVLPWFFRRVVLLKKEEKPDLYVDLIWGEGNDSNESGETTMEAQRTDSGPIVLGEINQ
ncbi:Fc.00g014290.m01.CDS01 [Cosmosporella sp. VM-42]